MIGPRWSRAKKQAAFDASFPMDFVQRFECATARMAHSLVRATPVKRARKTRKITFFAKKNELTIRGSCVTTRAAA